MSTPRQSRRVRTDGVPEGAGPEPGLPADLSVDRGPVVSVGPEPPVPGGNSRRTPLWRGFNSGCQRLDTDVGWDKLPKPLGLLVLIGVRNILRQQNLHDTSGQPAVNLPPLDPPTPETATTRRPDGSYNDLDYPRMGDGRRTLRAQRGTGTRPAPQRRRDPHPQPADGEPPAADPDHLPARDVGQHAGRGVAAVHGEVWYPPVDTRRPADAKLWITKLGVGSTAPWDIRSYARRFDTFPTDSTFHQVYGDEQFEAYRALGECSANQMLDAAQTPAVAQVAAPSSVDVSDRPQTPEHGAPPVQRGAQVAAP